MLLSLYINNIWVIFNEHYWQIQYYGYKYIQIFEIVC